MLVRRAEIKDIEKRVDIKMIKRTLLYKILVVLAMSVI